MKHSPSSLLCCTTPSSFLPHHSARRPQTVVRYLIAVTNLEGQAERIVAFCAARGWQVAQAVKECGSGVDDQRPASTMEHSTANSRLATSGTARSAAARPNCGSASRRKAPQQLPSTRTQKLARQVRQEINRTVNEVYRDHPESPVCL